MPTSRMNWKPLNAATALLRADRPEAVVVASDDDPEAMAAGGTCSEFLTHTLGRGLPVLSEEDFDASRRFRSRHVLAVGSYGKHRLITSLALRGRHYCDARFPGPEGFVLRTIHQPFGDARNAIVLCASDEAGWAAATEALCDLFTYVDERATIPPTNCVQSALAPPSLEPEEASDLLELLRSKAERDGRAAIADLLEWAVRFDVGGCPATGVFLRKGLGRLLGREDLLREPEWWLAAFLTVWRNIEERPAFAGEFRDEVATICWDAARRLAERWRSRYAAPRPSDAASAARFGAFTGLRAAGAYFRARHALAEAKTLLAATDDAFRDPGVPTALYGGAAEDQCRVLEALLRLALSGRTTWNESLARLATRWAEVFTPGAPRAAAFQGGRPSAEQVTRLCGWTSVLCARASMPVSPECAARLEAHYAPGSLAEAPEVEELARPAALTPLLLNAETALEALSLSPSDVGHPRYELLHGGVAMRSSTPGASDYLLLGGAAFGAQASRETQALLRFDHESATYIENAGEDGVGRGGLVIEDSGRTVEHRLTSAPGLLHAGRARVVVLRTLDEGVPTWRRAVVHVPLSGVLVIDEVEVVTDGELSVTALWPVAGALTAATTGSGLVAVTGDRVMDVVVHAPSEAKPRALKRAEDGSAHWLVEMRVAGSFALGERVVIATELRPRGDSGAGEFVRAGSGSGPYLCRLPRGRHVYVGARCERLAVERSGFEIAAEAYVLGAFLGLAGLERLDLGASYVETSAPCALLLEPRSGQARVTATVPTEVYASDGTARKSVLIDADETLDLQLTAPDGLHRALLDRASELVGEPGGGGAA